MNKLIFVLPLFLIGGAYASSITITPVTPTSLYQNSQGVFSANITDTAVNATLTNALWYFNGNLIANNTISGTSVTATQDYVPTQAGTFPMQVIAYDNQSNSGNVTTLITVHVNVSSPEAFSFPIEFTWNGNVYYIQGENGQNCALNVYNTQYQNGNYTMTTLLPPQEALSISELYAQQFQIPASQFICPVLFQEVAYATPTSTPSSSNSLDLIAVGAIVLLFAGVVYFKFLKQ